MHNSMICIYGLGDYGLKTYFQLKENGVEINFFADRSREKHGYALEGTYCKSYEELMLESRECLIIVAIKNPESLIRGFRQEGFEHVYDREAAFNLLVGEADKRLPARERNCLKDIDKIIKMKESIQCVVYDHRLNENSLTDGILLDYIKRRNKLTGESDSYEYC